MLLQILSLGLVLNAVQAVGPANSTSLARQLVGLGFGLEHGLEHGLLTFRSPQSSNLHPFDLGTRQTGSCPSGSKECNAGCIPTSYTCCVGETGGCPSTAYCDNGGCCPDGELCSGPGIGCNDGETDCGSDCVPENGGTCCADESGCYEGTYCYARSTGSYSCCENGETCNGSSGGGTTDDDTTSSTRFQTSTSSFTFNTRTSSSYTLSTTTASPVTTSRTLVNPSATTVRSSTTTFAGPISTPGGGSGQSSQYQFAGIWTVMVSCALAMLPLVR